MNHTNFSPCRQLHDMEALSRHQRTYRGALALNNYGVSVMRQGNFHDAITIFKDALSFMSDCITMDMGGGGGLSVNRSPSSSSDDEAADLRLNEALRLAMSRLVLSHKNPASHKDIVVCPFDEGDLTSMIAALQCVPEEALRFPVRLCCDSLSTTTPLQDDMNLPSAAIMHNHGLARLLAYEHGPENTRKKEHLLQGALCSLSAAHAMIASKYTAATTSSTMAAEQQQPVVDSIYDRQLRPLLLDAVVLTNLFRVHWYTRQTEAAHQVMTTLTCLLNKVQVCQDYLLSLNVEMGIHKMASAA
jgi:hypothetical protein